MGAAGCRVSEPALRIRRRGGFRSALFLCAATSSAPAAGRLAARSAHSCLGIECAVSSASGSPTQAKAESLGSGTSDGCGVTAGDSGCGAKARLMTQRRHGSDLGGAFSATVGATMASTAGSTAAGSRRFNRSGFAARSSSTRFDCPGPQIGPGLRHPNPQRVPSFFDGRWRGGGHPFEGVRGQVLRLSGFYVQRRLRSRILGKNRSRLDDGRRSLAASWTSSRTSSSGSTGCIGRLPRARGSLVVRFPRAQGRIGGQILFGILGRLGIFFRVLRRGLFGFPENRIAQRGIARTGQNLFVGYRFDGAMLPVLSDRRIEQLPNAMGRSPSPNDKRSTGGRNSSSGNSSERCAEDGGCSAVATPPDLLSRGHNGGRLGDRFDCDETFAERAL